MSDIVFISIARAEWDELLQAVRSLKASTPQRTDLSEEIIDRQTLCARLGITQQTVITWEKRRKIPTLRIGRSIRYDWEAVKRALSNLKK